MNKLPKHSHILEEYFTNVDYSKWERSNRTKVLKSTQPQPVLWASALPDRQATKSFHRPISERHSETPTPTNLQIKIKTWQGKNGQNHFWLSCCHCLWQSRAVEELEKHCKLLQEMNQQLARDIEDTDRHSVSSARELLNQHAKLGRSVPAYNRWSTRQIRQAKDDLRDVVQEAKDQLSGLQVKLQAVMAEVQNAQVEFQTLKTYKDQGYPLKALQIADLKRELYKLQMAQEEEHDDLSALCQTEMANLEKQLHQKQEEVLSSIAKKTMSYAPPLVKHMALQNHTMKEEIKLQKQEIMKLENENSALLRNIRALRLLRASSIREAFQNFFPKSDRYKSWDNLPFIWPLDLWVCLFF
uniref:Si:dkey-76p14.2 n=1 Tax=Electrophorus electricus TaxID=8005 RepID=A0A4W4EW81_ELEEL